LDGWSTPLLLHELLHLYTHHNDTTGLPHPRSYRDYLAWLGRQPIEDSVSAWKEALDGVEEPTLLIADSDRATVANFPEELGLSIDQEGTQALRTLARER
ncbi:condensation domain-containing protein, partial [Rhodococcus sp. IEGM 69]